MRFGRNDKCPCGSGLKLKKCHPELEGCENTFDDKEYWGWLKKDCQLGQEYLQQAANQRKEP